MDSDVDLHYRQHLTPSDLRLIAHATGAPTSGALRPVGAPVSSDLGSAFSRPDLEAVVFAAEGDDQGLIGASPFLTFAIAVHRTAERLQTTTFVEERWTSRQRLPMFDVDSLRQLLAEPQRRYFLVELLASYTHVVSGATWQRTRRGWRRRRFSELDLSGLAELLGAVEPAERPGVYRRLGDLALFLTGVFPDHSALLDLGPVALSRLTRLSRLHGTAGEGLEGLRLLEELGRRFYELAVRSARTHGAPPTVGLTLLSQIAPRFREARRALNVVTDWYLFPLRERWFGLNG
jgi:hypothetical protein